MSNVSQQEVPDDGGIGDMLIRRSAQERIAHSRGCDPTEVEVDYPVSRGSMRPRKKPHNNDGVRLGDTPSSHPAV